MPFQPGQSGNPSGLQASRPWRDAINRALARAEQTGKFTSLNNLADRLLEKAAEGDITALKELGDRIEGKAPITADIQVSGSLTSIIETLPILPGADKTVA